MRDWLSSAAAVLLPRRVVYWCLIRVAGEVTTGRYSTTVVPHLTFMEALRRWEVGP